MTKARRFLVISPVCLLLNLALAAQAPLAQTGENEYKIAYTGRLLGYARVPDRQSESDDHCIDQKRSLLADATLKIIQADSEPVLVGMGNNFSPVVEARMFDKGAGLFGRSKWQKPYPAVVPMDNVGCFLRLAGYSAVVPGKHDFWFGPGRLQQLARFLARPNKADESSAFHPVPMLAANLAVLTKVHDAYPSLPNHLKDIHKLGYNLTFANSSLDADLPSAVLPYLRHFRFKNARTYPNNVEKRLIGDVWLCPAKAGDPDAIELSATGKCRKLQTAEEACNAHVARLAALCTGTSELDIAKNFAKAPQDPNLTFVYRDGETDFLEADHNYGICAEEIPAGPKREKLTCKQFSVHSPLLQDLSNIKAEQAKRGVHTPPYWATAAKHVAVFGVVDASLKEHVGLLNTAWENDRDPNLDTVMEVVAPDMALVQLLQMCAEDADCVSRRKILLAQMPTPKAGALIGQFPRVFDMTIAEADFTHDTGNENLVRHIAQSDSAGRRNGFLVTPRSPYEPTQPVGTGLIPHVAVASITSRTDARNGGVTDTWRLRNRVRVLESSTLPEQAENSAGSSQDAKRNLEDEVRDAGEMKKLNDKLRGLPERISVSSTLPQRLQLYPPAGLPTIAGPTVGYAIQETVKRLLGNGSPVPAQTYTQSSINDLALLVMQRHWKADIAMIQKRDTFLPDGLPNPQLGPSSLQDPLNAIFWKGDYVMRTVVTGATLKKLVKQSKAFDEQDSDALSTELENGRGAIFAGLKESPTDKGTFYVNGVLLDDKGIYSIATTDYLAQGDTGYPDILDSAVGGFPRPKTLHGLQLLSALVCEEIASQGALPSAACEIVPADESSFDRSYQGALDTRPGFTTLEHYHDAFSTNRPEPPVRRDDRGIATSNVAVQQRSHFSVKLENADFGYSSTNVQDPANVSSNFPGVSLPQVTASDTHTFQVDYRLRIAQDASRYDWFGLSESKYQSQWKRGGTPVRTHQNDLLAFEGGINPRVWKFTRPSGWRGLISIRWEQPLRELDPTKLAFQGGTVFAKTAQTSTYYGKFGVRYDRVDTWIEAGYRIGRVRNLLDHYTVNAPGSPICRPDEKDYGCLSSVTTALGSNDVALTTRKAVQDGLFFNFNWKVPLQSKRGVYFVLANQGAFFRDRPGDTSVDTRYMQTLSPSFTVPLFGKFSLTPKTDVFVYQNKVHRNVFVSVSPAVTLQYQFNWRVGEDWKRALIYGSTQTPSN